jgi:hypothetical protein
MSHISLIGRLTVAPELTAPKGNPVCRFRIAVDRTGIDGAEFITNVSFGARGENDARLSKGGLVAIARPAPPQHLDRQRRRQGGTLRSHREPGHLSRKAPPHQRRTGARRRSLLSDPVRGRARLGRAGPALTPTVRHMGGVDEHSSGYARPECERRFLLENVPVDADQRRMITERYITGTRLRLRTVTDPDNGADHPAQARAKGLNRPDRPRFGDAHQRLPRRGRGQPPRHARRAIEIVKTAADGLTTATPAPSTCPTATSPAPSSPR